MVVVLSRLFALTSRLFALLLHSALASTRVIISTHENEVREHEWEAIVNAQRDVSEHFTKQFIKAAEEKHPENVYLPIGIFNLVKELPDALDRINFQFKFCSQIKLKFNAKDFVPRKFLLNKFWQLSKSRFSPGRQKAANTENSCTTQATNSLLIFIMWCGWVNQGFAVFG